MLVKFIFGILATAAITLAVDTFPNPSDIGNYFSHIGEQVKPFFETGSGSGSGSGSFPTLPSFPNLGSFGGSTGHNMAKRQSFPDYLTEWFQQFGGNGNNPLTNGMNNLEGMFSGLFPGGHPSGGSSGSSEVEGNTRNHI